MSERGSEEGTAEPERNAALETQPDEGEEQCPELIADELDSDDFDSDSADPPRRWRRANPHSQGLYEFTQERLGRASPHHQGGDLEPVQAGDLVRQAGQGSPPGA